MPALGTVRLTESDLAKLSSAACRLNESEQKKAISRAAVLGIIRIMVRIG